MPRRHGARLAALLAPALLLAPVGAHAASATFDDVSGDAQAVNVAIALGGLVGPSSAEGPILLDAPAETSVDVLSTTVDHARKRLTLGVQLRDLVDTDNHSVEFRIVTPDGRYALVTRTVGDETIAEFFPLGRSESTTVVVSEDGTVSVTVGDAPKPCRTVRSRQEATTDTILASVPTACLGTPTWVQVSAAVSRTKIVPLADGSANISSYIDDAFRGAVSERSLGRSPKVRRG